jgi:hypothetical protein
VGRWRSFYIWQRNRDGSAFVRKVYPASWITVQAALRGRSIKFRDKLICTKLDIKRMRV